MTEEMFEQVYIKPITSNGIHGVDFIKHRKTGSIVRIMDYIKLIHDKRKEYEIMTHIGIKQELKKDIWMFALFTSHKITYLNEFIVYNIELTKNIHKYASPPIIVQNSTFCEYFVFIEKI